MDEEMTFANHMEIFYKAKRERNFEHALCHLGCALYQEPDNEEALGELEGLVLGVPHLEEYVSLEGELYASDVAVRAYIEYMNGHVKMCFNLMRQVLQTAPQVPYLCWFERWVKALIKNPKDLDEKTITYFAMQCIHVMEYYCQQKETDLIEQFITLYQPFVSARTDDEESLVDKYMVMSMYKRRVNDIEGAIEDAKMAYKRQPISRHATFIGLCYKQARDIENAEKYFEKGYELDQTDISPLLEMGDLLVDEQEFIRAGAYYKRALEVEPENDWALPSLLFCKYFEPEYKASAREKLLAYCEEQPENERADYLRGWIAYIERVPYLDYIPQSSESTINVLHQMYSEYVKKGAEDDDTINLGNIKMAVSGMEAPSAYHALKLAAFNYDEAPYFTIAIGKEALLPSFAPIHNEGIIFWDTDCSEERIYSQKAALPKPNDHVVDLVMSLATKAYSMAQWYDEARVIAREISKDEIESLFGIMVHTPNPHFRICTDIWLQRIQYAAVCILAHIDCEAGISKHLRAICKGQLDWPIIPTMAVLAYKNALEPSCQKQVLELFELIEGRIFKEAFCFFKLPFLEIAKDLHGLSEAKRNAYEKEYAYLS